MFLLFPRCFKILGFTFSCVIYFELTFVYDMRHGSNIVSAHVAIRLFQHQLLKLLSLLHSTAFSSLAKNFHIGVGFISGFSILSH